MPSSLFPSHAERALLIQQCSVLAPQLPSGLQERDVLLMGNRIEAVGAPGTLLLPASLPLQVLDGQGKLVFPGLVNAHTHSPENVLKATMPSLPVELWGIPLYSDYLPWSPRLTYLSALLGALEMLKSGTTAVLDHHWSVQGVALAHLDAVMQAYADVGIRATVAPFIEDHDLLIEAAELDGLHFPAHPFLNRFQTWSPLEEQMEVLEHFFSTWHHGANDRLRCLPGPVGIQWCSASLLQRCQALAEKHETGMHLHAVETQLQAHLLQRMLGKGGIAFLAEEGVLQAGTSLAHAIWLEPGDLELLATTRTTVVHNPISNLRLGSGRFPLSDALTQGVTVALGSDGSASNDTQNMWSVLKVTGLVHNQPGRAYSTWPQAGSLLEMALRGGAAAVGRANEMGRVAPGQLADLVVLDLKTTPFFPLRDPVLHLVYCEPAEAVETVIVDGQIVLDQKQHCTLNEAELRQEVLAYCATGWPGFQGYLDVTSTTREVLAIFDRLYQMHLG